MIGQSGFLSMIAKVHCVLQYCASVSHKCVKMEVSTCNTGLIRLSKIIQLANASGKSDWKVL